MAPKVDTMSEIIDNGQRILQELNGDPHRLPDRVCLYLFKKGCFWVRLWLITLQHANWHGFTPFFRNSGENQNTQDLFKKNSQKVYAYRDFRMHSPIEKPQS